MNYCNAAFRDALSEAPWDLHDTLTRKLSLAGATELKSVTAQYQK